MKTSATFLVAAALMSQGLILALPSGPIIVRTVPPPPAVRVPATVGIKAPKVGSIKTKAQKAAQIKAAPPAKKAKTEKAATASKPASIAIRSTLPAGIPKKAQAVQGLAGGTTYSMRDGRRWEVDSNNRVTHFSKPGMDALFDSAGRITTASVRRPGGAAIEIAGNSGGARTVTAIHSNGIRVVNQGANAGYVQRPLAAGLVARTLVAPGKTSVAVYRPVIYGGATYYAYVPSVLYAPAFYAWAYNPWIAPVSFAWAWDDAP